MRAKCDELDVRGLSRHYNECSIDSFERLRCTMAPAYQEGLDGSYSH